MMSFRFGGNTALPIRQKKEENLIWWLRNAVLHYCVFFWVSTYLYNFYFQILCDQWAYLLNIYIGITNEQIQNGMTLESKEYSHKNKKNRGRVTVPD